MAEMDRLCIIIAVESFHKGTVLKTTAEHFNNGSQTVSFMASRFCSDTA
jgi:hypothetical protein